MKRNRRERKKIGGKEKKKKRNIEEIGLEFWMVVGVWRLKERGHLGHVKFIEKKKRILIWGEIGWMYLIICI